MSVGSKDGAWRADAKQAAGVDVFGNEHVLNTDVTGTLEVDIVGAALPAGQSIPVTQATVPWLVTEVPTSDFDYVTGSLTAAGSVIGFGNCKGIRIKAVEVDSKFAISGGTPITLRSDDIFQIIPQGELLNPTVDWFAGSIDVWMEVEGAMPPTIADLGLSLGIAHI